jgi:glyoxylase-like metal-dependent hydrolase (beta-lactamase superfamily II)
MSGVRQVALAVLAAMVLLGPGVSRAAQTSDGRGVINAAAAALGGADRVRAVRNITLHGYGQYAYMFGGGRITAVPEAPEKYIAANDLRRVYDLQNDRFEQQERRNMLFPFLATFGHSFALNDLILDGDVAFDRSGDRATQVPRYVEGPLHIDGVYMRRMWMLNNPVVLVRAALDPATRLSTPRREGANTVVDLTLKTGERLSAGFAADGLPAFVRWRVPHPNLGEAVYTTSFSGYGVYGGLQLPLGYATKLDWRDVDYFKLYVDNYEIDTQIANLSAPAAIRSAPEPVSYPKPDLTSVAVAPGIWRISNGTTVIAFKDHLTLFELGLNARQAQAVIDYARTLAPGKPITQLITSHNHFDHIAGIRQAVANDITIIARRPNEGLYRELVSRKAVEFADDLAKAPKALKFMPVDERLRLSDETMTVEVYWVRNNIHMAEAVLAYVPSQKLAIEGDIATAAYDYQFWPDNFRDNLERYGLQVERVSPVHHVVREGGPILTMTEIDALIKGGADRARERCAQELAKGNYFAGCPVHSRRY